MGGLTPDDRKLVENSASKFVDNHYAFEKRYAQRKQGEDVGSHWSTFAELGWLTLPFAEEAGGMGGSVADAQALTRAFGRGLVDEPWLDVVLAGLVIEAASPTSNSRDLLAALMSGETRTLLAHAEECADPDFGRIQCLAEKAGDGYQLSGSKAMVWHAPLADSFLVSLRLAGEPAVFLLDRETPGLTLLELPMLDGQRAADLRLERVSVGPEALLLHGQEAEAAVSRAILLAFGMLVGEVRGIADRALALTAGYLKSREQFGKPLADFQALQHLLADMAIAREEIESLEWATGSLDEIVEHDELERLARCAKARACSLGRSLCETGIQLHGGIGLTDEYVLSHYLRRMVTIDSYYGDAHQHLAWLAERV